MSFVRKKEIPPKSGKWYGYEVQTFRENGKVRQRVLRYMGRLSAQQLATMEAKTKKRKIKANINRKLRAFAVSAAKKRELFYISMASKTGIELIDKLTINIRDRDFRNDVRQQAALYYIEEFGMGSIITESQAKELISRSISFARKFSYSSHDVSLYKRVGENGANMLADILSDDRYSFYPDGGM